MRTDRIMSTICQGIILLAGLSLEGCTYLDVDMDCCSDKVGFESAMSSQNGDVTTTYTIPDFRVSAFRNHEWGADLLMDNVVVTRTGINSWIYSPPVDWPENESVDFFAVSPASYKINNNQWWYHTLKFVNENYDTDLLISVSKDVEDTSGKIRLNFRHALAKIQFRLKSSDPDAVIDVSDIKLCNVAKHADFFFPDFTTSAGTDQRGISDCWKTYDSQEDVEIFHPEDGSYVTLAQTPVTVGPENLFLLPDSITVLEPGIIWRGTHIQLTYLSLIHISEPTRH